MGMVTGGQLVARMLKEERVRHVFTLCGLHVAPIYAGLVFFGWGLLTALAGVFVAPWLAERVGQKGGVITAIATYAAVMALAGVGTLQGEVWLIGLAVKV